MAAWKGYTSVNQGLLALSAHPHPNPSSLILSSLIPSTSSFKAVSFVFSSQYNNCLSFFTLFSTAFSSWFLSTFPLFCIVCPMLIYFPLLFRLQLLHLICHVAHCAPLLSLFASPSPFLVHRLDFLLFPLISHHFPSFLNTALSCTLQHFPLCLIPSLVLHQTNSYIIQHGNERVRERTRPRGLIHLLYLPITVLPCPYKCVLVGRRGCPSNYIGVQMIMHADEQPCNTLSISIAWASQVHTRTRAHVHTHTYLHTHICTRTHK